MKICIIMYMYKYLLRVTHENLLESVRMYLLKLLRHQDMSQLSHTLLLYLVFYMLYQRGVDF